MNKAISSSSSLLLAAAAVAFAAAASDATANPSAWSFTWNSDLATSTNPPGIVGTAEGYLFVDPADDGSFEQRDVYDFQGLFWTQGEPRELPYPSGFADRPFIEGTVTDDGIEFSSFRGA